MAPVLVRFWAATEPPVRVMRPALVAALLRTILLPAGRERRRRRCCAGGR